MSEKSHVSMEQHQCPVCGNCHDTGAILFQKNLRQTLQPKTVTGEGFCPKCQELKNNGYIALIEVDDARTRRLGGIAHIRSSAWGHIFNVPAPEGGMAHVPTAVMDMIEEMANA